MSVVFSTDVVYLIDYSFLQNIQYFNPTNNLQLLATISLIEV